MRKIFIGGLPRSVSDETLRDAFSRYGTIIDFVVMKDPNTKESRGFGFIEFDSEEPVNQILKSKPHVIQNREVEIRRAMPKEITHNTAHDRTRRMFIGGLSYNVTNEMLAKYYSEKFSNYGKLESAEVKRERNTNKSRGFGFITFDTEDAVDAVLILDPKPVIFGRNCEVKKSEPKRVIDAGCGSSYRNARPRYRSPPRMPVNRRPSRTSELNEYADIYNQEHRYERFERHPSAYHQDRYGDDSYYRDRDYDRSPMYHSRSSNASLYYENVAPTDYNYQSLLRRPQAAYDRYDSVRAPYSSYTYRPRGNDNFCETAIPLEATSSQVQEYANGKKLADSSYHRDNGNRVSNEFFDGHYDSRYSDRNYDSR